MSTIFTGIVILFLLNTGMACTDLTLGIVEANPATSCNEIYKCNPVSRGNVGDYWIRGNDGVNKLTCNMKLKCGGIEGGWMQVVDVDMNKDSTCPKSWQTITNLRTLCVGGTAAGCTSAHFSTHGVTFEHICGTTKSYQKGFLMHSKEMCNLLTRYTLMEYQLL